MTWSFFRKSRSQNQIFRLAYLVCVLVFGIKKNFVGVLALGTHQLFKNKL
jgi:hypothetical protein